MAPLSSQGFPASAGSANSTPSVGERTSATMTASCADSAVAVESARSLRRAPGPRSPPPSVRRRHSPLSWWRPIPAPVPGNRARPFHAPGAAWPAAFRTFWRSYVLRTRSKSARVRSTAAAARGRLQSCGNHPPLGLRKRGLSAFRGFGSRIARAFQCSRAYARRTSS